MSTVAMEGLRTERRLYQSREDFSRRAHVGSLEAYRQLYQEAEADPEAFWARAAGNLDWFKRWDKVLDWKPPFAKWFLGGELNLAYNCLDQQAAKGRGNKAAIMWEGEPGDIRTLTYRQVLAEVSKLANALTTLGVRNGDRIAIYMGMEPELPISMLSCARIGAPHTVIFGGFSSNSIADRIKDCEARVVITQDGTYRRGSEVKLKAAVDQALVSCPSVS
jgi:acetyl-CoA synthetase